MSFLIAVHGGADHWTAARANPQVAAGIAAGIAAAVAAGEAVLQAGGSAIDAAQAAVRVLEDDPRFNAGRGATLTRAGHAELDAAIHDGASGRAGAVAGLRAIRSPVAAARLVLERSGHVLMSGPGAEAWLLANGAEAVDPSWFITDGARAELAAWRDGQSGPGGTVGAVARDRLGRLAAATSTGGLCGKLPGRIGDCPVIGAGTWADSHAAISCTGAGECFIRAAGALRAALSVGAGGDGAAALDASLAEVARQGGGTGGMILVGQGARPALRCSSSDMACGWSDGAERRAGLLSRIA
jgi:beta-aspartyl-peptidase (threonine type)